MDQNRKAQLLLWAHCGAAALGLLLLLPLTLPVAIGLLTAAALEPMILGFQRRMGRGRGISAFLCVTGTLLGFAGAVWALGHILLRELTALSRRLPALLDAVASRAAGWLSALSSFSDRLPQGLGDALTAWTGELASGSGTLAQRAYDGLFSLMTRLLRALPGGLFFLVTAVLACYFAAAELPRLRELAAMRLPERWRDRFHSLTRSVRSALGSWVRAQLRLMGLTFLVLLAGFLLLGVESPLTLALGIALLDALPLLGTGTVLLPWAAAELLQGRTGLGLGLAAVYGCAALLRNVLEPRLLGAQLGISPLLTLTAIYAGWRIGGFWGMLLLPVVGMTAFHLWQSARPRRL